MAMDEAPTDPLVDPRPPVPWVYVAGFSSLGLIIGILDILGWNFDSPAVEFGYWTAGAAVWIGVFFRMRLERPFVTMLLAGVGAGIVLAVTLQLGWGAYVENNPSTVRDAAQGQGLDPYSASYRALQFAIAPAIGGVWGALVGGVTLAVARLRGRGPAALP